MALHSLRRLCEQVLQVRYKKTGQVFAMKVLNKKTILDRNELVGVTTPLANVEAHKH